MLLQAEPNRRAIVVQNLADELVCARIGPGRLCRDVLRLLWGVLLLQNIASHG